MRKGFYTFFAGNCWENSTHLEILCKRGQNCDFCLFFAGKKCFARVRPMGLDLYFSRLRTQPMAALRVLILRNLRMSAGRRYLLF